MELKILSLADCEQVRKWRNQSMESLRTPYELTQTMQGDFYEKIVCNPSNSPHRYWGIYEKIRDASTNYPATIILIGMAGITNIQWENRIGEISLIIAPEQRGKGHGKEAVNLLLDKAFNYMNLKTVFGEVYSSNPAYDWWKKLYKWNCWLDMPNRKYYQGQWHSGVYFSIDRDTYYGTK